ncbi:hypothetical protein BCR36DRAFT_408687 [Piromyces finnis]|uniref:Uncharacterized protein n=1 Tax=Piromyces finnis TaxID=1754191 RepID=A0A1Y1VLJ8_9FUNG|nr:hypothetical protein BCR36DRAFT_408687 [Piromyces finnis]|eukprot:ORX59163.1 hypothetical protein BCR36DRAFT_408687 [Piromyces finnis]
MSSNEKIKNKKENDIPSNINNNNNINDINDIAFNKSKKRNQYIRRRYNNNNNNNNNDNKNDKSKKQFHKKYNNRNNYNNKKNSNNTINNNNNNNNVSPKQKKVFKEKNNKELDSSEINNNRNLDSKDSMKESVNNACTILLDNTTSTVKKTSSSDNSDLGKLEFQKNLIEALIANMDKLYKKDSGSFVYNNFNINIINNQTNEITNTETNNEVVTITENKQINNTTKTNNVKIEENINNSFTTINNYNTNYNVFNNPFFDYISHILNKGCVNKYQSIRILSKISKCSYITFCLSVNFCVNFLVKTFIITKWVFMQFKDFDKIFKGMIYFIIFVVISTYVYRNEYCWNFVKKFVKTLFHKDTTPIPEDFSKINEKIQSTFSAKEFIKILLRNSTKFISSLYNETEQIIIKQSMDIYNYASRMMNSTSPVIKNTTYQMFSAFNSTIVGSIPFIQKSSDKIQSSFNSIFSTIKKNEKVNNMAHSLKDTVLNTTPKIVSTGNEVYQSVNNFVNSKILNNPNINNFVNKIKNDENINNIVNKVRSDENINNVINKIKNDRNVNNFINKMKNILNNPSSIPKNTEITENIKAIKNVKEMSDNIMETSSIVHNDKNKAMKEYINETAKNIIKNILNKK